MDDRTKPPKSSFSFFLVAGINVRLRHEPPLVKSSPKNMLIFRQKKPARDDVTDIQIISCTSSHHSSQMVRAIVIALCLGAASAFAPASRAAQRVVSVAET